MHYVEKGKGDFVVSVNFKAIKNTVGTGFKGMSLFPSKTRSNFTSFDVFDINTF